MFDGVNGGGTIGNAYGGDLSIRDEDAGGSISFV